MADATDWESRPVLCGLYTHPSAVKPEDSPAMVERGEKGLISAVSGDGLKACGFSTSALIVIHFAWLADNGQIRLMHRHGSAYRPMARLSA